MTEIAEMSFDFWRPSESPQIASAIVRRSAMVFCCRSDRLVTWVSLSDRTPSSPGDVGGTPSRGGRSPGPGSGR